MFHESVTLRARALSDLSLTKLFLGDGIWLALEREHQNNYKWLFETEVSYNVVMLSQCSIVAPLIEVITKADKCYTIKHLILCIKSENHNHAIVASTFGEYKSIQ